MIPFRGLGVKRELRVRREKRETRSVECNLGWAELLRRFEANPAYAVAHAFERAVSPVVAT
jgi:hypothetical protein